MLVLTSRPGQTIIIYDPKSNQTYEVHLVDVRGDQVRVGIQAPKSVPVDRAEIAALRAAHQ